MTPSSHATVGLGSMPVGRDRGLDALRGFAILIVIVHHVGLRFPDSARTPIGEFLVAIGWGGVDLFFAISGFLITRILLRLKGAGDIRGFFIKRFFRIVPLYLLSLAVFLVGSLIFGNDREVIGRLWMNLLFLTAWVIPFVGENGVPYTITWSVSVEETAYLLFGALALLGPAVLRRSLGWIVLAAIAVRGALILGNFVPESAYYFAPGRLDAIALGGLVAAFMQRTTKARWTEITLLFLATLVMLGVLASWSRHDSRVAIFGYTAVGVVAAALVGAIFSSDGGRENAIVRAFANVGLVSYFIYLFHGFVIAALHVLVPEGISARFPVEIISLAALLLTYIPAVWSWKLFERPLITYGRRVAERERGGSFA